VNIHRTLLIAALIGLITSSPVNADHIHFDVEFEKNFVLTFINYDEDLVNQATIIQNLPSEFYYEDWIIDLNYEVIFANDTYESQINQFVDTITTEDWTSKLNETALIEQKNNFKRKDIFERQNGTSINVEKLTDYLGSNKPETNLTDNLYHIFIFNQTRLDSGSDRHWFNVTEVDPGSEKQRFYWRLEWDYPMNYDVRFPYAAYSKDSDITILDPTAFQWYLNWRAIWNMDVEYDDSYFHPLQDLIKDQDWIDQKQIVNSIISNWLEDWIVNVYNMYTQPENLGNSLYTGIQVVYDSEQVDQEDLEWIVNEESIIAEMGELLQSTSVDVNIEFVDIQNETIMKTFVDQGEVSYAAYQNAASPFENWSYYDGGYFHDQMEGNVDVKNEYFGIPEGYDQSLTGLILLLDNASFVGQEGWIPWSGGLYTGLGGIGRTAILYELDRAFMPDMSKKSGLSKILIHELGHAVGLPHTFYSSFTSDFSNEVMGYYPGTHQFSEIVKQAYWSELVLNKIRYLQTITSSFDTNFVNIEEAKFAELVSEFRSKDFVTAYHLAMEIIDDVINYSTETIETTTTTTTDTTDTSTTDFRIMAILPLYLSAYLIRKKRNI
jgi:hypothetical protein